MFGAVLILLTVPALSPTSLVLVTQGKLILGLYPWFWFLSIGTNWGRKYRMGRFHTGSWKLIQVVLPGGDEMCTIRRVSQYQQWIAGREVLTLCYYPISPQEPSFLGDLFRRVQNVQKGQQWGLHVFSQRDRIESHMELAPLGACPYGSVEILVRAALLQSINLYGTYVTIVDVRIVTWWYM